MMFVFGIIERGVYIPKDYLCSHGSFLHARSTLIWCQGKTGGLVNLQKFLFWIHVPLQGKLTGTAD